MEAKENKDLSLQAGDNPAPRLTMGEVGYTGLKLSNEQILEESRTALRWPYSLRTYKEMASDQTIASALSLLEMLIARTDWYVEVDKDAPEDLKKKAAFVQQCMEDMDHSWYAFMSEVTSSLTYGFCVNEKVYRRRLKSKGSKYNDGLIGLAKLPVRSQDTIKGWKFSGDGRQLEGVIQDLALMNDAGRYIQLANTAGGEITIPRKKFLLFRTDPRRDNPEGKSPLSKVYLAWRYIKEIREQEAIGITRDLAGMPVLKLPPKYMSADATPEEKAVYEYYQRVIRNIQNNEQTGLILPQLFDPESRQPLFEFTLMGTSGGKSYDTNSIVQRYSNEILQALFADVLKLGSDNTGSYGLAENKSSLVFMAIEARLKEIQDVLNNDLMKQLFEMNGWSTEVLPKFQFKQVDKLDLGEFAKALQQLKATSLIAPTPVNINYIAEQVGLPDRIDEDMPQDALDKLLGKEESRSGDGAKTAGEGTSKKPSGEDKSSTNLDNK